MKVECWFIGKTSEAYLREGEAKYAKKLSHYLPFKTEVLPDVKRAGKLNPLQLKQQEAEIVLQRLKPDDGLIVLDEGGTQFGSVDLAQWLDAQLQRPYRRLIFLVGGAFGFDQRIYERANGELSLSRLTFSHQMVRLFLLEQLYRAMTILRHEPYHNS
ncbi:MAG: 23S rRNA (pseudouridine(1915)-N(3))-methyltransferase RlmH [Bacteroidetes bacterium]|nr:MAG: 23S rRNA (pseudouridine(1915)-N(3))-methyltransferase RlmH [Bacteroidota bacterium]